MMLQKQAGFSDFTIVKDGENIKMSHDCKQSYDSTYEEFETIAKSETFTKTTKPSGGEDLDAFAGTWVGKPFASEVTLVCDGKGPGTFAGNAIAYTVKGDTIEFECGGCACVVTKSGDKLSFTCDDSEYMPNFDLTKRA